MSKASEIISIMCSGDPVSEILANRDRYFRFIDGCMIGYGMSKWHHEGDVWKHTELAIASVLHNTQHDWLDILIALLHDIGKKAALEHNEGKNMVGHDVIGADLAELWMREAGFEENTIEIVKYVVRMHMRVKQMDKMTSDFDIMEIATHSYFPRLKIMAYADCEATLGEDWKPTSNFDDVLLSNKVYRWNGCNRPAPIVQEDDLLEAGVHPTLMEEAIRRTLKQQINGKQTRSSALIASVMHDPVFLEMNRKAFDQA